jgi:drug/metabolite transporter (DMT)-like permease
LVALSGAAFGAQSILAKVAYDGGGDVPTVLAVRFAVASCVVWSFLVLRPGGLGAVGRGLGRRRLPGFAALGLLFVASALLAYSALERLPAGTTTLLVFAYPALVVLWSRLLYGERLTSRRATALALALLGCALTIDPASAFAAGAGVSVAGVALALGSAVSNSWYATLAGPVTRGVPSLTVAAVSLPVTAVSFLAGLALRGGPPLGITPAGWLASAAIGLLVAAGTTAFLAGVARIGPSRAAISATSEPATAVLLGVLLLGEPLTVLGLLGGACILGGIVLLTTAPANTEEQPDPGADRVSGRPSTV